MKTSVPTIYWREVLRAICVYEALLGVLCGIIALIGRWSVEVLFGPYLAFAVPGATFLLVAGWLWNWEARGALPKRLALVWGLSTASFFLACCVAFFYASIELLGAKPSDAAWVLGMMIVGGTAPGFYITYGMTLKRLASRAT